MLSVACAARPRLQNALRGVQALPPFVTEVACVGHPPRSDGQQRHPLLPMPACVGVPLAPPPTPRYAATQRHHGRQPHRRRRMLGVRLAQEPCAGLTPWTFPTRTVPTPRNEAAGGACCPTAGVRNRRSASQKGPRRWTEPSQRFASPEPFPPQGSLLLPRVAGNGSARCARWPTKRTTSRGEPGKYLQANIQVTLQSTLHLLLALIANPSYDGTRPPWTLH